MSLRDDSPYWLLILSSLALTALALGSQPQLSDGMNFDSYILS